MRVVTDDERRARLARRHRLIASQRSDSVADIADSVVALHSTDPATVYLSIAARSNGLTVDDVERALYEDRSVLRHHAMRRTLWVSTPPVAEHMHAACTRKIAERERRQNVTFVGDAEWFDDAVRQVVDCVTDASGPLSTREIGELLPELKREVVLGAGTRHEVTGSAHTRVVLQAAFEGHLVRGRPAGTWINGQYPWLDSARWSSVDWHAHTADEGMLALVRAWLERFGPGTETDVVWWTGSTKAAVRTALGRIDVTEVELSNGHGVMLSSDDERSDSATIEPWAAVVPGLDPTAMGWKERAWYLDDATAGRVVDRFGNIGPTVWSDGEIVGGWVQRPDGRIVTELTRELSPARLELIEIEIERIRSFVGDARFKVRFPSPNQPALLA